MVFVKNTQQTIEQCRKFLIVRTDRIGDVILSTPIVYALKDAIPEAHITFLCCQQTAIIGERTPAIDKVLTIDKPDGYRRSFTELIQILRAGHFDCAVAVHPTLLEAVLLKASRIPLRIGTGYRWYSFLYNKRHYEHRKESVKHEAEYNLALLEEIKIFQTKPVFKFMLFPEDIEQAGSALAEIGMSRDSIYCIVHPGSGGSAMNWKPESYTELCRLLSIDGELSVVLSWGPADKNLMEYILHSTSSEVKMLPRVLPLPALAAVLQKAVFVVAPSTGVIHLANSMGTPVIGLYPPIFWESPTRWGPYGNSGIVFVPDREKCQICYGGRCRRKISQRLIRLGRKGCMDLITPQMVFEAGQRIVNQSASGRKDREMSTI
jgi:ADP-heptose:LPS heptosyltransferase